MANNGKEKPGRSGPRTKEPFVWRKNQGPALVCTWYDIEEALIHDAVHKITKAGAAVLFGLTSDGGAFSVCVLEGDRKIREYPHGKGECEELLAALASAFDA